MINRVCYIELETKKYTKKIENIDFNFNIKKSLGSFQNEATIGIYNLSKEDVNYLNSFNPFNREYVNTKKLIRVYAGYRETGYGLIFQGDIWSAIPSGMPDTILNIKAKSNYSKSLEIIPINFYNISTKAIATNIANMLNLSLQWKASKTKIINQFNYTGSKSKLIEKFNELDNIIMYCNDKNLIVIDKNEKKTNTKYAIEVNMNSGMIGEPEPNCFGVKVKTLLNPNVKCGDWINLKSNIQPYINGYYQVFSLENTGQARGNDFYSILDCKRRFYE